MSLYGVSAILVGHASDVRCVKPAPPVLGSRFSLVTGSRDGTAKVWSTKPETKDLEWKCDRTTSDHGNYVFSVATVDPNDKFPQVSKTEQRK